MIRLYIQKLLIELKNDLGKGEDNDIRSEEKILKKSSQMYNSGFNYEDNNNNNSNINDED